MQITFGDLMRAARIKKGIEPEEVARRFDMVTSRIYQIETGRGGLPRRWLEMVDFLEVPRDQALRAMSPSQQKRALTSMLAAGEPGPLQVWRADGGFEEDKTVMPPRPIGQRVTKLPKLIDAIAYTGDADDEDEQDDAVFSPEISKAARLLLGWSQAHLAKESGVSASTISNFESGNFTPHTSNRRALRDAFSAAGVAILEPGQKSEGGYGVRYRK